MEVCHIILFGFLSFFSRFFFFYFFFLFFFFFLSPLSLESTRGKSDKLITAEKSKRLGSEVAPYREASNSTLLRLKEDQACAETMSQNEVVQAESNRGNANTASEIHSCDDELVEPSNGAIDLIGAFDNRPKCTDGNSSYKDGSTKKFEFVPHLELSLRRTCPSSSNYQGTDERHTLIHSNASAFSW
jgi:pseudo-response regulator 5